MPADEIMRRFYAGTLKSSNGAPVKKLSQAKAIASSYGNEGERKKPSRRLIRTRPRGKP